MLIFFLGFGWVCGKAFLSIADDVVKQRYSDVPSLGDAMISGHENMVCCKSPWNFLRSSPMLSKLSRQNLAKEAASGKLRIRTRFSGSVGETISKSQPIGSMYGIFSYIWLIFFGKCREIYHAWIPWAMK